VKTKVQLEMERMKSSSSAEVILKSSEPNDLFHLKLRWISTNDENLKKDLSERIRRHLTS